MSQNYKNISDLPLGNAQPGSYVPAETAAKQPMRIDIGVPGGLATFDDVAMMDPSGQGLRLARATLAIPAGAASLEVAFANPELFPEGAVPHVTCTLRIPADGDNLWAWIAAGSVTALGFTARWQAPTPAAGYQLTYIALL